MLFRSDHSIRAETSRATIELADILTPTDVQLALAANSPQSTDTSDTGTSHILVVDDNSDLRAYISSVLQRQGYQVRTAHNGAMALEMIATEQPHLILTDLMMPGMSGLELLHEIRTDERLISTPVILLTANVDHETRIEGVEQGAAAYPGNPFNDRDLLA